MSSAYLMGCDVLGADVGMDIMSVNKAVRGVKPLSVKAARSFVTDGIKVLTLANSGDSTPGLETKRNDLLRQLQDIEVQLLMSPDPVPEKAAEVLRNAILEAVAQFNQVAEKNATLSRARGQLFQDMVDNAESLAKQAGKAAEGIGTTLKWTLIATGSAVGLAAVAFIINALRRR